jgi:hypothetical protein
MSLTCGQGGSTGAEIVTQINANTDALVTKTGFYRDITSNHLDLPETYTEVGNLAVVALPVGEYVINVSSTWDLDVLDKSVFAQLVLNGGTPEEFSNSSKDLFYYGFPYSHTSTSDFSLILNMRKEDATGTLDVLLANLWLERKA